MKQDQINPNFDVELIKVAIDNCEVLDNIALQVKSIDPKTLSIDGSTIWGLETGPIKDRIPEIKGPSTIKYVALRTIEVEALARSKDKKNLIVNGEIELPYSATKLMNLDQIFLKKESDARELASLLTDHQLARALLLQDDNTNIVNFLQKQQKDKLF